ncbi:MAG: nucleotide exchange factor GrpE [Candidatus Portnoybacteria bacterium]|nr:nucleotide exchange factor GrpE [Candidatus Portnoybacteria bacterium]MDD4983065.1 nucleotide exchange factor GrpE [Candidatus Portnoybacteria bacterium]
MDKEEKGRDINYEEENNESAAVDMKDKLGKMKEKLEQCQKEKQDNLAGWQRAQADFINYRRRQEEQMGEWSKMFGEGLLRDLLPVLDTLDASAAQERGEKSSNPPTPLLKGGEEGLNSKGGVEGLKIVRDQLMKILSKHGLMEMKAVGEKFDPALHEAVECVEAKDVGEGAVVEEVQKGYLLNGKIIRAAKVKVSK